MLETIIYSRDQKLAGPDETNVGITIETITPAQAVAFLENAHKNRPVSHPTVLSYASDMTNGKWMLTGEAIIFDQNGKMTNGQHRMRACILADVPFKTAVVRGVLPAAMNCIDTGRPRTTGDVLSIQGCPNGNRVASAVRYLLICRDGDFGRKYSTQEITETLNRHLPIIDSAKVAVAAKHVPGGQMATIHYIGSTLLGKKEEADAFLQVFRSGQESYPGDPAFLLRERIIASKLRQRGRVIFGTHVMFVALIHAWNLHANRRQMTIFQFPKSASVIGLHPSMV